MTRLNRRAMLALSLLAAPAIGLRGRARAADVPVRAEKSLRILILGGTGFTGPHQVRYALARGHKVTLFNRGREPNPDPGEVEVLTGDRNAGDLKALAGREWDVCIDNPTSLPFWVAFATFVFFLGLLVDAPIALVAGVAVGLVAIVTWAWRTDEDLA